LFLNPVEPDKGLDVLREWKEVEDLDAGQRQGPLLHERLEIPQQGVETAGEVDDAAWWILDQRLSKRRVEPLAGRIDDDEICIPDRVEPRSGGAGEHLRPPLLRLRSRAQPALESSEAIRAALVESQLPGLVQEPQSDGADAAVELGHAEIGGGELGDPVAGAVEERQMALAEGAGREEDVDPAQSLAHAGVVADELHPGRAEDRVAALRLAVEEESLEPLAHSSLDRLGQPTEHGGRRAATHEHDLHAIARPLDHELDITDRAAMGSLGVGLEAGLADRLADCVRALVQERMVDGAVGDRDDPMAAGLEEPEAGTVGAPADGEAGAVAMAPGRRLMDRGLGQSRPPSEGADPRDGALGRGGHAEARAAGAGRTMGAGRGDGHRATLALRRVGPCAAGCYAASMSPMRSPQRPQKKSASASVCRADFLPTTRADLEARGWNEVDVVFVTGDAYVDHPSFAMAILGRWLEAHGFRVAILAQPDWQSAEPWRDLGRPRLFYAVSAGNMDSMINHYTANRKRRNADAYSPGGRIGLRPDRPTAVYAQRCREAFKGVPVITGGVEASLRRIAHYDYWSDRVWPTNLVASKADLLAYGMGEDVILEIARRLERHQGLASLRSLRGVAYLLGRSETLPESAFGGAAGEATIELPAFETVKEDRRAFAEMTRAFHHETNPANARRLVQPHGDRLLVVNPPALALDEPTMDRLHELPYTREPHPDYDAPPPAWETIKDSVQVMRGCFGGCTFCSITMHQGREIQSRSPDSILREVEALAARPDFKGGISDLGGPTANMYRMRCTKPEVERVCRRLSCVHPKVCKLLGTDHGPILDLMRRARAVPGVKRVHIASGIRMDLAADSPEYLEELAAHHVGGHLKVAPEHVSERVLDLMKKPGRGSFEIFAERFAAASKRAGKEQYLVPYFIASHPGSTPEEMIELAIFLKQRGYRPRQVQDFIPAPMDLATCMYWTGLDPMTMKPVETARRVKDRNVQRALLQFFAPENWATVRDALRRAGREDLIGDGPDCLIPARPPRRGPAGRGSIGAGTRQPAAPDGGARRRGATERAGRGARPRAGYRRPSRERGRDR